MQQFALQTRRFQDLTIYGSLLCVLLLIPFNLFAAETLYAVKPGDTLWEISKVWLKNPNDWKKLQQLNKIKNPHKLVPNTFIRIPVALLQSDKNRAVIQYSQGNVTITDKNGKIRTVKLGLVIYNGDKIITGAASSIRLQFETDSTSSLQENSQLTIEKIHFSEDSRKIQLQLLQGNMTNDIIKSLSPNSRFIISTPSAVASVRGTTFRVSNDPLTQQFRTEVLKGSVGVSSQGKTVVVKNGFGVAVKKGQPPNIPTELLPAVNLSNLAPVIKKMPIFFGFLPIKNAISYRLELSSGKIFNQQISGQDISKPEIRFTVLASGDYIMRVFAYNKNGLGGQAAYHQFEVKLPIKIPPLKIPMLLFPDDNLILEDKAFNFSWGKSDIANGYHFQLANDAEFKQLHIDIFPYYFNELAISDRLPNGRYFWHVAALSENNTIQSRMEQFTETRSFRIPPPVPALTTAHYKKTYIILSWNTESSGVSTHKTEQSLRYRIQASNKVDFSTLLLDTIVLMPQYKLSAKEPGDYFIRVSVIGADGYAGEMSRIQYINLTREGLLGQELLNVNKKKQGEL